MHQQKNIQAGDNNYFLSAYNSTSGSQFFGKKHGTDSILGGMEIQNTTLGGNCSQKVHLRTHHFGGTNGRRLTINEKGFVGINADTPDCMFNIRDTSLHTVLERAIILGSDSSYTTTGLNIGTSKEIRLQDNTGGQYIGMKAKDGTTSYTLTFPAATGSADQILTTNGSGQLSFVDNSGGTSWQAIKTTTYTAAAGEGIFANTSGGAWTLTLPSSPSIGDEVSVVDYAGTFDTNNLTIGRNSKNIQGSAADLTVATERAGFTLVFTDGTQGWLLKNN